MLREGLAGPGCPSQSHQPVYDRRMGRGWIVALLTLPIVASAHPGNGIVALSDRAVITGDALHNAVWRFEKGKVPVKLTGGTRFHCHWVTKGLDGRLYSETLSERSGRWVDTAFRMDSQGANPSEVASGAAQQGRNQKGQ